LLVPLAVQLAELHRTGQRLFVTPGHIVQLGDGSFRLDAALAQKPPTHPRDKACLAPEQRAKLTSGDARASVFSVGAILYEMATGELVGPGMQRPSSLRPDLPPALEQILGKALVSDPAHRPDDLNALAQALHHVAPAASQVPPPADESHLDHDNAFDVDVSLSMLPPAPSQQIPVGASPYDVIVRKAAPKTDAKTAQLADLKARLEADPRPRFVVVKDGMDHGPFNAVELLQQIATHTFLEQDELRDSLSNETRVIAEWPEFAPFAEQARLHRDIKAEKQAFEVSVAKESKSTRTKTLFGLGLIALVLAGAGFWLLRERGRRSDELAVHGDHSVNVETDAGLAGSKKGGGAGRRVIGNQGGIPILGGGMSCEAAYSAYNEEMKIGGNIGAADLTREQYGSILNSGSYFGHCGVPNSMGVNICAAVQNGKAVGVTVTTSPNNAGIASCIAASVRGINFPSRPRLDVTHTVFAPAK